MQTISEIQRAENSNFRPKPILNLENWLIIATLAISITVYYAIGVERYAIYKSNVTNATASKNWVATSGTIIASATKRVENALQSRTTHYHYQPFITYEYVVKGKTHRQNQISFPDPSFGYPSEAIDFAAQYQVGDSVKVFYDPNDPKKSCLNNGITDSLKKTFFWRVDESHNK